MKCDRACGNPSSHTCVNCRTTMCWLHINTQCPQGKRTRYGVMQHLTATLTQDLNLTKVFEIDAVQVRKQTRSDQPERPIAIRFSYCSPERKKYYVNTFPGRVSPPQHGNRWTPDDQLSQWLAKMGMDSPVSWQTESQCIAAITKAIKPWRS